MSFQDSAQRVATRPVAAGLLIALAGPLLGLCPLLAGAGLGLGLDALPIVGLGTLWTLSLAYFLTGIPSIIAGVLTALAIARNGWISTQHWRAVTAILTLAWITLLGIYVKVQPASLGLSIMLYLVVAAIFASWALRLIIVKLRWMRQPARDILRVVH